MAHNLKPIEYSFILLGDSSVGKSSIFSRLQNNSFSENPLPTLGIKKLILNFDNIEIDKQNNLYKNFKVILSDTAGQERYKAITSAYYKGAKGAFVVYDITRKQSFDSVDRWINDLRAAADKNLTIIIIGNKCDLEDQRQVNKEQGEEKAKNSEVAFMETSALSGENLDKAFEKMINEVYKKCHEEMMADVDVDIIGKSEDINLGKTQPKAPAKKKCC